MMVGNDTFLGRDEFIVNYQVQTGWGFPIALDFFFSGTGAALFLFSLIFHSLVGTILSLIFIAMGVVALFLDLGTPWRFWKAFARLRTSWISRGSLFITLLFVFGIIYALSGFRILSWFWMIIFGAVSILVMLYPGMVISYSPSITVWNSQFIPILLSLHSLTSGLSIISTIQPSLVEKSGSLVWVQLGLLLFLLIGAVIYLTVSYASVSGARESIRLLAKGGVGFSFYLLGIGIGMILPMIFLLTFLGGGLSPWGLLPVACIMRLVGDLGFRYGILKVGLYDPHL
jgi:formate-dependent nitrite reductase membrane component NrfD